MKTKTTPILTRFGIKVFFSIVLILNAALTFRTGSQYCSKIFDFVPGAGTLLGGLTLLILLDGSAAAWSLARSREKLSSEQIAISTLLIWGSLLASIAVSLIAIITGSELIPTSTIKPTLLVLNLAIILGALIANAIAIYLFTQLDPQQVRHSIEAASAAQIAQARATQLQKLKTRVAQEVESQLAKSQERLAKEEVAEIEKQYLDELGKL